MINRGYYFDYLLSRQVSNLNSSDPETDVLPITPQDSFMVDPSRLELELFWTKTRRVANYTTGQSIMSYYLRRRKSTKFFFPTNWSGHKNGINWFIYWFVGNYPIENFRNRLSTIYKSGWYVIFTDWPNSAILADKVIKVLS